MGVGVPTLKRATAASARHVRLFARAIVFGLVVGALVAQLPRVLGGESVEVVADRDPAVAVERVFAEQQSLGRTCHRDAVLTDSVIFAFTVPEGEVPDVRVLTFDEALAAAEARAGWVLSYCL